MAYLDELYSQVRQKQTEMEWYKAAISECSQKRSQAISRRCQVETINKCLRNDFDSTIEEVNKKIKKVVDNLEDAFKGDNNIASDLISDVNANKELADVSDTHMLSATGQLDAEHNALTQFISQMDTEIGNYQMQYNECNTTITSLNVHINNEQNRIKEVEKAARKAELEKNKPRTQVSYSSSNTTKKTTPKSSKTIKKKRR